MTQGPSASTTDPCKLGTDPERGEREGPSEPPRQDPTDPIHGLSALQDREGHDASVNRNNRASYKHVAMSLGL